ncbi:MAG: preprotein translocase subunit YajC [Halobacteriovoraceae bacterium]|jgi:preprotein translocase subunit YajC|nr:preprotein translocase subunit YajC [Halobacteriovoraceae bacterium]MBC97305.1 preprotein translocase subunit YajC [Halobacteriovoraceae bacterium]|tara:strand:- start:24813 stop:25169 length:357 start_codon:yes stop_codon:yes gene_type:complete
MKKLTALAAFALSLNLFAQEGGAAPSLQGFLPIVIIGVIFYFFMIRPEAKKQKEQKALMDALQKGDEVYTSFGILGTVVGMTEKVITLEISENAKVKVLRSQIAGLSSKLFEKKETKK